MIHAASQHPSRTQALPPLRDELGLTPGPDLESGAPTWTLHDPVRNTFYRLGRQEFEMLGRWGLGDADAVQESVNRETTLRITGAEVEELSRFLKTNLLIRPDTPSALASLRGRTASKGPGAVSRLLRHYLFFRIPLVRPDRFLMNTLWVARLFVSRPFLLLMAALGGIGLILAVRQWEGFAHTFLYFFSPAGIVFYLLALFGTKLLHELAHAYTSRYYGLHVPTMGIAFLVLWPVFYSDNTEAWKLRSRRARMTIVSSGILTELALALTATFLWSLLPDGPLRSACFFIATVTWISSLMINLSPFLRFDGYYLLSDAWDVPNLHARSSALGRWHLRKTLLGLDRPAPEALSRSKTRRLIAFAYATWIYRLVLFTAIALMVYHFFFKALGLFLFGVEITAFILLPVFRELQTWWGERGAIGFNRHVLVALSGLVLLGLILALPFSSRVYAPALLRAGTSYRLYPPFPARLDRIAATERQRVRRGEILFEMCSPELLFEASDAEIRIRMLESQMKRQAVSPGLMEMLPVLRNRLSSALTERDGARAQADRLTIRAPADGIVTDLADGLRPGLWIYEKQLLCILVRTGRPRVEGYLEESRLGRVESGDTARFYEEGGDMAPIACRIRNIDLTSSRMLEDPYLASVYGGDIPVRRDASGLASNRSMYRVLAHPSGRDAPPRRVYRGTLLIHGRPESLLARAWRRVYGVAVRESGF